MTGRDPTSTGQGEVDVLRRRLAEAEQTIEALVRSEVDTVRQAEGRSTPVLLQAAHDAIRAREEQYRALFDNTPLPVLITEAGTARFLAVNPAATEQYGWSEGELLAMHTTDIRPEEDVEQFSRYLDEMPSGRVDAGVWRHLRKDGSVFLASIVSQEIPFWGRRARLSIVRDVTGEARAEEAIRRSVERFRALVERSSEVVFVLDADGRPTYVSPAIEGVLGYSVAEYLQDFARLDRVHPDDRASVEHTLRELATSSPGATRTAHFRYRHRRGDWRWVEATAGNRLDDPAVEGIVVNLRDTTEQQRTQQRFDQFFHLCPDLLAIAWSGTGRFLHVNPAFERVLGHPRHALEGASFLDFAHPDDVEATKAAAARLAEGRPLAHFENRYRHADGRWRWLSWTVDPPVDGLLYCIARDVTDARADAALTDVQQHVLEMIATDEPVESILRQLVDLWADASEGRTAGFVLSEPGKRHARHVVPPRLSSRINDRIETCLRTCRGPGTCPGCESFAAALHLERRPVRAPDAQTHPDLAGVRAELAADGVGSVFLWPLTGPEGEVLGALELFGFEARELSEAEQRAADLAVRLANIALTRHRSERQRRLLEEAVSHLSDAVILTEAGPVEPPGPATVFVNKAFEKLFGCSFAEIVGRSPYGLHGPEMTPDQVAYLAVGLRQGRRVHDTLAYQGEDGARIWVDVDIDPVHDSDGRHSHWIAVLRDVTERLELEEQFLQSQKMEAVGRLSGGVAHDFNNLLTVILGGAHLLLEDAADGDPALEDLQEIVQAARRAKGLTRQLLTFSRKQTMQPRTVDVGDLVDGLEKMLRRIIGEDFRMEVTRCDGPCRVWADPGQLEQVLMNLAVNARDAMDEGGVLSLETMCLDVDAEMARHHPGAEPGPYGALRVADTGAGMSGRDDRKPASRGSWLPPGGWSPSGLTKCGPLDLAPTTALGVSPEVDHTLGMRFGPDDARPLEAKVDHAPNRRLDRPAADGHLRCPELAVA